MKGPRGDGDRVEDLKMTRPARALKVERTEWRSEGSMGWAKEWLLVCGQEKKKKAGSHVVKSVLE